MKRKIILFLTFCAISLDPIFAQGWNNESTPWEQSQKAEYVWGSKTTQIAHRSSYEGEKNRWGARHSDEWRFRSAEENLAYEVGYVLGRVIFPAIGVAIIIGVIVHLLKVCVAPSKKKQE